MANIRIEFNSAGFKEILMSEGTKELVETTAQDIADRANANSGLDDGFQVSTIQGGYGGGRWVGFVSTADEKAKIAEAENGALTGAIL